MVSIEKFVDMAIIGENYLSYIFGLRQLSGKKSALVIDDNNSEKRFHKNSIISIMEMSFLKTMGMTHKIESLENINRYLTPKKILCITGNVKIILGQSPSQNLIEIGRKLPSLFDRELFEADLWNKEFCQEFDKSFHELAQRVGSHACKFSDSKDYDIRSILIHCPPKIRKIFKFFSSGVMTGQKQNILTKSFLEYRSLLFLVRAQHHRILSSDFSEIQLFYLFMSLLSPVYYIDEGSLSDDLKQAFLKLGGKCKRTHINSFYFDSKRPWRFEMDNIEGIVGPKKLSFFGHFCHNYHLEVNRLGPLYNILRVSFNFNKLMPYYNEDTIMLMTKKGFLGTQFPMIKANIEDKTISFSLYYLKKEGQKTSFFKAQALEFLRTYIHDELGYLEINTKNILEIEDLSTEVFYLSKNDNRKIGKINMYRPYLPSIREISPIVKGPYLKNTFYFGPAGFGQLGTLSDLINISHYEC